MKALLLLTRECTLFFYNRMHYNSLILIINYFNTCSLERNGFECNSQLKYNQKVKLKKINFKSNTFLCFEIVDYFSMVLFL